MKKFCLRANYLALFKRTSISISTKKELKINESKIACCPITLFACLVELWKGENLNKVTLGNSYWTRESQYDIGVGSTNETQKFFLGLYHAEREYLSLLMKLPGYFSGSSKNLAIPFEIWLLERE